MQQKHEEQWIDYFRKDGHPQVSPLASGMEGAVYSLGNGLIGKVWSRRQEGDFAALISLYTDLDAAALPFATPLIHEVRRVEGRVVTIERELRGIQLQDRLDINDASLRSQAVDCLASVLRALRSVTATVGMQKLAVLDESRPLWENCDTWPSVLISLMNRRVERFGDQLRASLSRFDGIYRAVVEAVAVLPLEEMSAVHGDLCGVNVLVDHSGEPTAVLDFGFLSTSGDPAFDVAVTSSIYNMYGPHSNALRNTLLERFASEFDYPLHRLLLYEMAYAIITSNAYDPLGKDGHFAWCVAILNEARAFS